MISRWAPRLSSAADRVTEVRSNSICLGLAVPQGVPNPPRYRCREERAGLHRRQYEVDRWFAVQQHQCRAGWDSIGPWAKLGLRGVGPNQRPNGRPAPALSTGINGYRSWTGHRACGSADAGNRNGTLVARFGELAVADGAAGGFDPWDHPGQLSSGPYAGLGLAVDFSPLRSW